MRRRSCLCDGVSAAVASPPISTGFVLTGLTAAHSHPTASIGLLLPFLTVVAILRDR
ncbi:BnaC06g13210D [Brassica napus]|uniref:BnaC06g13210D protein n=1 Tax=Brassica napus TaxID=3708 RepID=A0A078FHZ6_BRANA|nr:BnaC06g13210D [Brassica napus]